MIAVLHWGVIRREERYLKEKFGDPYREYRSRMRRWI
jgi:protein-S-isoprenylcysteine O-methyltransferase Ste14